MIMAMQTVGVVGAGTMGNGIAQVLAASGRKVLLAEASDELLRKGIARVAGGLDRLVKKGKMTEEQKNDILKRIQGTTNLADLAPADLVVEAVTEEPEVKLGIFRKLDAVARPEVILASNTSSISISRLAACTKRPDRVVGMHFFNPVPVMTLVEVVKGELSSEATVAAVTGLAQELGKTPVTVNDYPGFVANRVLMPMINEAVYALMEGVATREAIDTVMKLGMNHPMGPLTLADFIGLDVCLAIMEVLHRDLGDAKYRPCPLLRRMVAAGLLGRKSGAGFYSYAEG
jgi:3-hydroxybutyryl-CoA dehydrogenase